MAATLGHQVEKVEDRVRSFKGNGNNKEITEKEEEVSDTEAGQEVVENTTHWPAGKEAFSNLLHD